MVLRLIKSSLWGFKETIQPIKRVLPGKYTLIGKRYIGDEFSVKVDWREIIELDGFCGFYHEHPIAFSSPSIQDDLTMDSWVKATGKAKILIIKTGKKMTGWIYFRIGNTDVRMPMPKYSERMIV